MVFIPVVLRPESLSLLSVATSIWSMKCLNEIKVCMCCHFCLHLHCSKVLSISWSVFDFTTSFFVPWYLAYPSLIGHFLLPLHFAAFFRRVALGLKQQVGNQGSWHAAVSGYLMMQRWEQIENHCCLPEWPQALRRCVKQTKL